MGILRGEIRVLLRVNFGEEDDFELWMQYCVLFCAIFHLAGSVFLEEPMTDYAGTIQTIHRVGSIKLMA